MRGAAALVSMRMRGVAPSMVFLDAWCPLGWLGAIATAYDTWHIDHPHRAHLMLDRADVPARVDLRCIVGLAVMINEDNAAAARAMRDACVAAGARRVIASACDVVVDGEITRVAHLWTSDTEGHMAWPR